MLHRTDPKPSDSLLKAALLRRAVTDVRRILRVRDDKAALSALLQKGSIDEELWINFQQAEKELEAEIVEVVTEANTFVDGWGQIIFQSAGEIVQNEKHRDIFAKIAQNKKDLGVYLPPRGKGQANQMQPPHFRTQAGEVYPWAWCCLRAYIRHSRPVNNTNSGTASALG